MLRVFFDMDGVLAEYLQGQESRLWDQYYFRDLPPVTEAIKAAKELQKFCDVYVCSAVLADSKYALQEKKDWCDKFLSFIPRENRIFTVVGKPKSEFIPGGIDENSILIDDFSKNLHQWNKDGGPAIKFMNGINGNYGSWKGLTASNADEIVSAVKACAEVA